MIIDITENRMGDWHVKTRSKTIRAEIEKYMQENGYDGSPDVYLGLSQDREALTELLCLKKWEIKYIENGWTLGKQIEQWTYLQGYVGYDAGDRM